MTQKNIITSTDSYKTSHFLQYPDGAEYVSSYIEPRVGGMFDEVVFFGLQVFIREYLETPITKRDVEFAAKLFPAHGVPFNKEGWMTIVNEFGGYLPIQIRALPEGTVTKPGVPQVEVVAEDPRFAWLTSYIETALLRAIWYPSTVASLSRAARKIIMRGLEKTSDDPQGQIDFKLHDFGARGATSGDAAMIGGMGHLLNFLGTDTVEALIGAMKYYDAEDVVGFSIPASEHSTMTSWGKESEYEAYENMLRSFPDGPMACVSDSYDIENAVKKIWGKQLSTEVSNRNGVTIVRPDSGDPLTMPLDVIEWLMDAYGYTINGKGFKVLPDFVRVIQGDGMNLKSIEQLIENAIERGISIDNFAMGMGGGLLQKVDRDTCRYAMKANAIMIDGEWYDVFKKPASDPSKASKRGRQAVVMRNGELTAIRKDELVVGAHGSEKDYLEVVWANGDYERVENWEDVRNRVAQS